MNDTAAADPLVTSLYDLIRTGELSPGQRVDQRAVSERLDVSRTPLREALRALASDGVLVRTPNQGYAVAKLSAGDLLQYYALRTFLESEVLRSIAWPDEAQLQELRDANKRCHESAESGSIDNLVKANREFHFIMFSWSPLNILKAEIERVWRVSDPYRSLHLSNTERRRRVTEDHQKMIEAIEAKDAERLVSLMDAHRSTSRQMLQDMLGSSLSQALLSLPQSSPPAA
ncbi:GntR family transcriptional regulator [Rhodococcus sp. 14C212]|uniref:GntR family transcriptional regulator n=1 Tax=Rhodococcus TaxID=1827 RepID=UPI000928E757|nr:MULTISPECIES: GntR family transcriptional regulator [unclassified Rhodococcus (in: high G+C Gram-positive bacteria)]NGP05828.1 GntR family transcriptional regulator [Rhodococcus sp. 14C212]OLL21364.1 GntR family transcriptional regulator [Rhodococcus sp. M8]OOL33490.1 GntR family transcriptional regulator [Rhodococcus rhodochrous]QPG43084.1 GntR family transcriptional regulator [Rhodococcus sp. M8]